MREVICIPSVVSFMKFCLVVIPLITGLHMSLFSVICTTCLTHWENEFLI